MSAPPPDLSHLLGRFVEVRGLTEQIAAPLSAEDQLLQSMPDASPTKWHRAHTTWFFERFVLGGLGVEPLDNRNDYLWNSYYDAVGSRHPRPQRGLLSRPSLDEVAQYRRRVDERVQQTLSGLDERRLAAIAPVLELGLAHEQQHQELILTDIQHALSLNPLRPAYGEPVHRPAGEARPNRFTTYDGGLHEVGWNGTGFAFDNEGPRHRVFLEPFALADDYVTVGDVLAFVQAGGYRTPAHWLSEGWQWVQHEGVESPLYWEVEGSDVRGFTLEGTRLLDHAEPASHLSFYEADAIARFLGGRLPSEFEWEHATREQPVAGHFLDLSGPLSPSVADRPAFGSVWTWTRSAYAPYPGYAAGAGALGEYNGKFMVGQLVLRGGSCLTPPGHMRPSYRNFWPAGTRFQMTGVRLARDVR